MASGARKNPKHQPTRIGRSGMARLCECGHALDDHDTPDEDIDGGQCFECPCGEYRPTEKFKSAPDCPCGHPSRDHVRSTHPGNWSGCTRCDCRRDA